ncbi:MAG: site-specific integrase [Bacteroidota bacterium]
MKPAIIFKRKNKDDNSLYCYVKYKKNNKLTLESAGMSFIANQINWGGKTVAAKHKNEKLRLQGEYINSKHPDYEDINIRLRNELERITRLKHTTKVYDKFNFISFLQLQIDELEDNKKYGTSDSYATLKKDMELYLESQHRPINKLMFPDITSQFIKSYENYLTGKRRLKANTVSTRMYKFKAVYELAIENDVYSPTKNVFYKKSFDTVKAKKPFLLPKEVVRLMTSPPLTNPIRGHYLQHDDNGCLMIPPIERARLMFIAQIFFNGIRVSDVLHLRWGNFFFREDKLKMNMLPYKTYRSDKELNFDITTNALWVLQHFIDSKDRFEDEKRPQRLKCVKCGSFNIIKGGNYRNSKKIVQVGKCKDCSRSFQLSEKEERKPEILKKILNDRLLVTSTLGGLTIKQKSSEYIYLNEVLDEIATIEKYMKNDTLEYYVLSLLLIDQDFIIKYKIKELDIVKFLKECNKRLEGLPSSFMELMLEAAKAKPTYTFELKSYHVYYNKLIETRDTYIQKKNAYLMEVIKRYAKEKPISFVFQMLNDDDFKSVPLLGDFHNVHRALYTNYMSKSKRYNALLKKIQKHFDFAIPISTHTARYTFTYLMLENSCDVYTISRLLGHSSIAITNNYLPNYLEDRANLAVDNLNTKFDIHSIAQSSS